MSSNNAREIEVRIRHAVKRYGDNEILKSVSCDFPKGVITVIVGRSGSGKSTLLRAIAGLTELDEGDIDIEGEQVFSGPEPTEAWDKKRSGIGMIFQRYTLWPHLNVYDNLSLAPRHVLHLPDEEIRDKVSQALKSVSMEEFVHTSPRKLSGGQCQRIAIARALMMSPKILLCDEITSALDPPVANDVLQVLLKLKEEHGLTIILVTHDMTFAAKAADRIIFLDEGNLTTYPSFQAAREDADNTELQRFVNAMVLNP